MSARTWTRDPEAENFPEWASRVYRSDDGWTAERYYVQGDRGLVHPAVVWEVSLTDHPRSASGAPSFRTLAQAKAWPDSDDAREFAALIAARVAREAGGA